MEMVNLRTFMPLPLSHTGHADLMLQMILEQVREHALLELDIGGHVLGWNNSIGRMFGYGESEFRGANLALLFPPEQRDPEAVARLVQRVCERGRYEEQMTLRRQNGQVFQGYVVMVALPDQQHIAIVIRDLAVLIATHEQFHNIATVDQLTGLANRQHLYNLGRVEYRRWRRYKVPLSLLTVSLDQFNSLAALDGLDLMDGVLRDMADLLKQAVREVDLVAHLDGGEFVAMLPNTTQEGAAVLAERVRRYVNRTEFRTAQGGRHLSSSLAVMTATGGAADFDEFVEQGRRAMQRARELGGDRIIVA